MIINETRLDVTIENHDFDFDGLNDEIDFFGKKNGIGERMIRNLQLAAEETVHRCITEFIEHNEGSGYPVDIVIEYSPENGTAKMTATYAGSRFDPFEYGDELSLLIVEKLSAQANYTYDGTNRFTVELA